MFFVLRVLNVELWKRFMKVKGYKDIWESCFVSIFVHFGTKKIREKKVWSFVTTSVFRSYFVCIFQIALQAWILLRIKTEKTRNTFEILKGVASMFLVRCVCVRRCVFQQKKEFKNNRPTNLIKEVPAVFSFRPYAHTVLKKKTSYNTHCWKKVRWCLSILALHGFFYFKWSEKQMNAIQQKDK